MLERIEKFVKSFFEEEIKDHDDVDEHALMIATAVLFLEIAYADFSITKEEETHMQDTLSTLFKLPKEEVVELIELAREKRSERQDIWLFSNLINEYFQRDQKIWILEHLWKLIYADGKVDKYEDHQIRKISSLVGLSHQEMIQAKIKAMQQSEK
jgi:uncharacterized tellurite resistance protein B-like protein